MYVCMYVYVCVYIYIYPLLSRYGNVLVFLDLFKAHFVLQLLRSHFFSKNIIAQHSKLKIHSHQAPKF